MRPVALLLAVLLAGFFALTPGEAQTIRVGGQPVQIDAQTVDLSELTVLTDISALAKLTAIKKLLINGTGITDLSPLATLSTLEEIDISDTSIEDLAPLRKLANLRALFAARTRIYDLAPLAGLAQLKTLDVRQTRLGDAEGCAHSPILNPSGWPICRCAISRPRRRQEARRARPLA